MHESPEDIAKVQVLLDRSDAAAGAHLRSTHTRRRRLAAAMTGAVKTSAAVTAKPAPASAAAIQARVREVVLVTKASGSPASRNRPSAATAP